MYKQIFLGAAVLLSLASNALAINCYVCNATDSASPFQCGEWFERFDTPDIKPQSCDGVHGAQFCIKHIGRFEATALKCYQCSSADTMACSDLIMNMADAPLQPQDCDHVHNAAFCIKSTALNGGIGAKRFCSSKDLGNYCNYVSQKGDVMEYRSCIFTCGTDGCNGALGSMPVSRTTTVMIIVSTVMSILFVAGSMC